VVVCSTTTQSACQNIIIFLHEYVHQALAEMLLLLAALQRREIIKYRREPGERDRKKRERERERERKREAFIAIASASVCADQGCQKTYVS
jgi:hypothetical protein